MTLDEIFAVWDADSSIDKTEVAEELRRLPKLHGKYWRIFSEERLRLRKLEADLKVLKLEKSRFFSDGPDEDTASRGWEYPVKGRILRSDTGTYIDADRDIQALQFRIDVAREKVAFLEDIVKHIRDRGYHLRDIAAWTKFQAGG